MSEENLTRFHLFLFLKVETTSFPPPLSLLLLLVAGGGGGGGRGRGGLSPGHPRGGRRGRGRVLRHHLRGYGGGDGVVVELLLLPPPVEVGLEELVHRPGDGRGGGLVQDPGMRRGKQRVIRGQKNKFNRAQTWPSDPGRNPESL